MPRDPLDLFGDLPGEPPVGPPLDRLHRARNRRGPADQAARIPTSPMPQNLLQPQTSEGEQVLVFVACHQEGVLQRSVDSVAVSNACCSLMRFAGRR